LNFHLTERKKHVFMLILLITLTVAVRFQNDQQTDFDSYWLHAQAESIQLHESALWVYHPLSLFGYYPLSYPSGTMFYLATASEMTGLNMDQTVLITSILLGLWLAMWTVVIARRLSRSWVVGYVAGFITSLSPILINYTSYNAGGRVLVLVFTLPIIASMLHWYDTRKTKYLFVSALLLLLAFLTHRTAQFILVFVLAFLLALLYTSLPVIYSKCKKNRYFRRFVRSRYGKDRYTLIFDAFILIFVLAIMKLTDLIIRGRLGTNIERRLVEPGKEFWLSVLENWTVTLVVICCIIAIIIMVISYHKYVRDRRIIHESKTYLKTQYKRAYENPERYLVIVLGLVALFFFVRQFFGASFYSPSLQEYYTTELFSGTQPWVVMLNFLINYTTSVSALFVLYFFGFIALLKKNHKQFSDWFLMFSFVGFVGVLLDKRYVRLFLVPFFSIIISYAVIVIYRWLQHFSAKKSMRGLSFVFTLVISLSIVVGMFAPMLRQSAFGEDSGFEGVEPYWHAGLYLRALDCDCSTITTEELVAGVTIFASSGLPGGSHNIYYFIDEEKLQPDPLSRSEVWDSIVAGEKLQSLYYLPDWLLGGQYYIGRHTIYLFDHPFTDKTTQQIMEDYHERFYNHDKLAEDTTFLVSIADVKNVIYDNPQLIIYDLEGGRDT